MEYLTEETDILETVMDEAGYELDLELTWEAKSLFLGGDADLAPSNGTMEAAEMSENQDMELAVNGRLTPQHTGLYVREGSDYDPDVAGGKQEAIDAIVEDEARFGIGGWGLGTIPAYRLIFEEKYGYTFEEGGDFNIFSAEFPTLAQLLANEEIDAGGSGPPYNLWPVRDELKPLFWMQEELMDLGYGGATLGIANAITRQEYFDEHGEAVRAFLGADKHAIEYFRDNIDEHAADSDLQETLGADSEEEARWLLEFRYRGDHSPNEYPASMADFEYDDDRVDQELESLGRVEDLGMLGGDWQDRVSFQSHDVSEYYDMAVEEAGN